ncbi:DUF1330 domain-containing protein [Roseicitreum antarcticum]|uniref:Uncharacterized conserved protein, DUF1330 family n=1 Tax=Roseicitreum antarcticum TaxID=564137 RepID=A0A1H2W7F8_9RHOB|nr:DUF1330 domain-containing protein [Roseicitreum antarcticum]SDW76592.1 Uncharacterized conserved protein, DUF1330 family [Roseicitreum antarcticum]
MSAYIIARIAVTDPEVYMTYAAQTVALAEKAGGRFLVKGGALTQLEGEGPSRVVVIEFSDRVSAEAWYASDAYQAILPVAQQSSLRDLVIVDGMGDTE